MLICFCYITTAWQRHQCFSKVFHMFWAAFVNNKSQSFFFWLPFIHSFIHSFVIQIHESSVCLSQSVLGSSCALYVLWRTFSSDSNWLNSQFHIHKWNWELHTYSQGRREAFHPSCPSVHPSVPSSIHPWMASLQPMWLRFCCTLRNSHIIQQRFFSFFGEISPTGDKKKPSAISRKELKKRTSRTFAIFLRKKKRGEEFARFRQWVRVARLDLGRIVEKTLLSA
jgi:hypothetical protein